MTILVFAVDRDNDFGEKAGLSGPFIGREENLNAALALGLKDAEDSDTNTLLAAISMYDEMVKKGMDVEIANICGNIKVGYESDLALTNQLENVLEVVKPERIILVSDGAEDEYIYPIISSRVKVDSVRKVFVRQAPSVEGTFYIILKSL
jgi:putative membrane protein